MDTISTQSGHQLADYPASIASSLDCEICATTATLIQEGSTASLSLNTQAFSPYGLAARPGRVADFRRAGSTCLVCRVLLSEFNAQCTFLNHEPPQDDDVIETVYVTFLGKWQIQLVQPISGVLDGPKLKAHLSLVRRYVDRGDNSVRPALLEEEMQSIPIDESRIDLDRIKRWMACCDGNHQGTCHAIQDPWKRVENVDEISLIDVETQCICQQTGSSAYLAFSYVWGTDDTPLVADQANIDVLSEPGSLAASSPLGRRLPKSIRDAMTITSRLGYRYLWVDRLCIVQDDEVHKQRQLASMAAIYTNASITIIASHGDDSRGLPGSEPGHSPLRRPFSIISLPGDVNLLFDNSKALGDPYEPPSNYEYPRRGWTLQEESLSNRSLHFSHREVKWVCQKMNCREIYDDKRQVRDNRESSIELQLYKAHPDISTYGHLAINYTSRLLKYDDDAVNAFSAIIAAFSRPMKGGMFYGLPELFFEGMLLWQPGEPLLRRRQSGDGVPSWSFLGWAGRGLDLGAWVDLYMYWKYDSASHCMRFQSDNLLISCVEYFKVDRHTGSCSRIQSSYHDDSRQRLPKDIAPGGRQFRHRVEVPLEPLPPAPGSWLPILKFHTKRCCIAIGDIIPRPPGDKDDGCLDVSLEDESGQVVGAIRLNTAHREEACHEKRLDLIVISRCISSQCRSTRTIPELRIFHAKCPQPCFNPKSCLADSWVVPYDFYNVMWIGWNESVAYRRAVGRVLVSYWDKQRPEDIRVILG